MAMINIPPKEEVQEAVRVEDHLGLVRSLVLKFIRKGDVEDSELYSIGCLALVEATKSYDPSKSKFATWAWKIVRNRMLDEVKKSGRSRESSSCDFASFADDRLASPPALPVHMLSDFLGSVEGDKDAEMLVDHYLAGRSLSDIGRQVGFSKEWVRKRLQSAIVRIRAKNRHIVEENA